MRLVGKIKDAHGLKGELYILIFSGDTSWIRRLKNFGLGPSPVQGAVAAPVERSYTCAQVKAFKDGLIVKSPDIADRTAAESLLGSGFYVPEEFFVSQPGERIYLGELKGFTLCSPPDAARGEIVAFSSNGPQDLLVVQTENGLFDVPLVDAFLEQIDFEKRRVHMRLPIGLLGEDV